MEYTDIYCKEILKDGKTKCYYKKKIEGYCGLHYKKFLQSKQIEIKKCVAKMKDGITLCKCDAIKDDYCGNHHRILFGYLEKEENETDNYCIGYLKDGNIKCENKAKKDNYCLLHYQIYLANLEKEKINSIKIDITKEIIVEEIVIISKEKVDLINEEEKLRRETKLYLSELMKKNNLAESHLFIVKRPDLIDEWDFLANKDIDIKTITYGSKKYAFWKCLKNKTHEIYRAKLNGRAKINEKGSGCRECYIDSLRTHDKEEKKNAIDRNKNKIKINKVEIGDETEIYIENLLKDSNLYKKITRIGNIGGKGDIEIIHKNDKINYIQIKTLTEIHDDVYFMANKSKYSENMLFVMINKERNRFAIDFYKNIKTVGLELPFSSKTSKYMKIMYKDIELFKKKLTEMIPLSTSENEIPESNRKENFSLKRLEIFCIQNNLEFIRNNTNKNTVDGMINGSRIQGKFSSTNNSNKCYSISLFKSCGYLNGKKLTQNYELNDFDFLIVEIGGTKEELEKYLGNFWIVSIKILIERGIIKTEEASGRKNFCICPPDYSREHWSKKYWNDLSEISKTFSLK